MARAGVCIGLCRIRCVALSGSIDTLISRLILGNGGSMNTRIRYEKTEVPGQLVSVRAYAGSEAEYRVYLHLDHNRFEVVNAQSGQVMAEGTGASSANTKLKAKRALVGLGVSFGEETRNKVSAPCVA